MEQIASNISKLFNVVVATEKMYLATSDHVLPNFIKLHTLKATKDIY